MFAANHKAIFPSAALLTWCVLAALCVDFGFFHKLFQLRPEDNAIYRAATESAMAASFVIFVHTFLRIGYWHGFIRMLMGVWMIGQFSLIAVAIIDPRLAATFARLSFVAIGGNRRITDNVPGAAGSGPGACPGATLAAVSRLDILGRDTVHRPPVRGGGRVSGLIAGLVLLVS